MHTCPLSTSPAPQRPWTDIITVIITVYQADVCRTKHWPVLFRSSFALFFVFVGSWLCNGGNKEAYQVCVNLLGRMLPLDTGSRIIYNTLDLVQLCVLPLSPLCESLVSWSSVLCSLSCTPLWIVPALHIYTHASKYSEVGVFCLLFLSLSLYSRALLLCWSVKIFTMTLFVKSTL